MLTWNISAAHACWKSEQAPETWTREEQLELQVTELRRWKAHVVALQECVGTACLPGLTEQYALVGSVRSHCGFTHLYALASCCVELHEVIEEYGLVVARGVVGAIEVAFVAAHLVSGPGPEAVRKCCCCCQCVGVPCCRASW